MRSTEERGGRTLAHVADSPHHLIKTTHTHTHKVLSLSFAQSKSKSKQVFAANMEDGMGK